MARSRSVSVGVIVVGLVFAIAGAYLFFALTARPLAQAVASRSWTEGQCLVVAEAHELTYQLNGFVGRRVSFAGSTNRSTTWEALHLHVDERVPCWFDPDAPNELVLERQGWSNLWPFGGLVFLVLGLNICRLELRPRTGPKFWWGTMDNLGHATMRVGSLYWVVITSLLVLVVAAVGLALVLQPARATLQILLPAAIVVAGWLHALKRYLTQLSIAMNGALMVGQSPKVSIHVRTPFGTRLAGAMLVASEEVQTPGGSASNPRTRVLRELPLDDQIPRDLPGSLADGPNRISWYLDVVGPARVHVPVTVFWPASARTLSSNDEPRVTEASGVKLRIERARDYSPDDDIEGVIEIEGVSPPLRATLRLAWRSRADLGTTYVHPAIEMNVADLRRAHGPRASDLSYREVAVPDEAGPLTASDQRRVRIPVPDAPRTYAGRTLSIEWFLELVVDDTRLEVPITIS